MPPHPSLAIASRSVASTVRARAAMIARQRERARVAEIDTHHVLALQQLLGDDRGQSPEKVSLGVDDDNLRVRRARVGVSLRASASWSIAKPYAMRGVASMSRASRASIESIANARDVDEDARFDALGARRTLSMASVRGRRVKTDPPRASEGLWHF